MKRKVKNMVCGILAAVVIIVFYVPVWVMRYGAATWEFIGKIMELSIGMAIDRKYNSERFKYHTRAFVKTWSNIHLTNY